MSAPRILPAAEPRVETGTVQFGEDWPGLFIRGDNAFHYAMCLERALGELPQDPQGMDIFMVGALRTLLAELRATRVGS